MAEQIDETEKVIEEKTEETTENKEEKKPEAEQGPPEVECEKNPLGVLLDKYGAENSLDAIVIACENGVVEDVKFLLESIEIKEEDNSKIMTLLNITSRMNKIELVKLVWEKFEAQYQENKQTIKDCVAYACDMNFHEPVDFFLSVVAKEWLKEHDQFLGDQLFRGVRNNYVEIVKSIIQAIKKITPTEEELKAAAEAAKEVATEVVEENVTEEKPENEEEKVEVVEEPATSLFGGYGFGGFPSEPESEPKKSWERRLEAIEKACADSRIEIFRLLIEDFGQLNVEEERIKNCIQNCANSCYSECLKVLLKNIGEVDFQKNESINNSLSTAIQYNYPAIVTIFLENLGELDLENEYIRELFKKIALSNNGQVVEDFISGLKEFNLKLITEEFKEVCSSGCGASLEIFIKRIGKLDMKDKMIAECFSKAFEDGQGSTVKVLLDSVGDIEEKQVREWVLHAMKSNHHSIIDAVREKVGSFELDEEYGTELINAVTNRSSYVVSSFLQGIKAVDLKDEKIRTCLMKALENQDQEMVRALTSKMGVIPHTEKIIAYGIQNCCRTQNTDMLYILVDKIDKFDCHDEIYDQSFRLAAVPEDNPYIQFSRQQYPMLRCVIEKTGDLSFDMDCVWSVYRSAIIDVNYSVVKILTPKIPVMPMGRKTAELVLSVCNNNVASLGHVFKQMMDKIGEGNLDIENEKIGKGLYVACESELYEIVPHVLRGLGNNLPISNKDVFKTLELTVRKGKTDYTQQIVNKLKHMKLREENVGKLIHTGAMEKQAQTLRIIIDKVDEMKMDNQYVELAIRDASEKGFLEEVKVVIGENTLDASRENIGLAMKLAAENKATSVVKFLCSKVQAGTFTLGLDSVSDAACAACTNGDPEMLGAIIKTASANERTFDEADKETLTRGMKIASANGEGEIMRLLVASMGELTEEATEALVEASKNGKSNIVKILVDCLPMDLSKDYASRSIQQSALGNHTEALEILCKKIGPGNMDINNELVGDSFVNSAKNGYIECLATLINALCSVKEPEQVEENKTEEKKVEKEEAEAVAKNNEEEVKGEQKRQQLEAAPTKEKIMERKKLNMSESEAVGNALYHSSRRGHLSCVQLIIENLVKLETKGLTTNALFGAACNGHAEIVQIICSKTGHLDIEDNMVGAALWYAARKGLPEIVHYILQVVTKDEYGGNKKLPTKNFHVTQAVVDCYEFDGEEYSEITKMIQSHF